MHIYVCVCVCAYLCMCVCVLIMCVCMRIHNSGHQPRVKDRSKEACYRHHKVNKTCVKRDLQKQTRSKREREEKTKETYKTKEICP